MSMKKTILILISLCIILSISYSVFLYFGSWKDFKKISSYDEVAHILEAIDDNTLVLFDIDDTLIVSQSKLFWVKLVERVALGIKKVTPETLKEKLKPYFDQYENWFMAKLKSKENPIVIEPHIPAIIKSLQDRGIRVMALTSLHTGSYHNITSLPEWRYQKLKNLGIDFSNADIPDTEFTELPKKNGHYPQLYHGMLLTNFVSKGTVLGAFLDLMRWRPSQVIYFDNHKWQISSVAKEMHKRTIPFRGYEYNGRNHGK